MIGHRAFLGFRAQDGDPRLQVRGGQVRDQAPLESAAQSLFEGQDRLRWSIRTQDDLLAVLMDGIERMEELFLRPLLVRDELDVVDEQQVDPPVARTELVDLALLDARDELVGELLRRRIDHALARELGGDLVADGMHQVGLAKAHSAVQEERVVGVSGTLGDGQAGRMGQAVGGPDDEVRERVPGVDVGRPALAADTPRLESDVGRAAHARPGVAVVRPVVNGLGGGLGRSGPDDEFHLDAVPDDAREGLADQRPIAGLKPVLREAVRDSDLEPLIVDIDELGIADPGLVVGGRQGNLQLTQGGSPDLLRVHSFDRILRCRG